MPDMSGPEMIAQLGAAVAARPVVFVTGYAGDKGMAAQIAGYPMLRKPFTIAQLAAAIDEALAPRRGVRLPSAAV
jgi:FixJ family two-component response regulator